LPKRLLYAKEVALANNPLKWLREGLHVFRNTRNSADRTGGIGNIFGPSDDETASDAPKVVLRRPVLKFSWTLRLAIVMSVLWPLACAAYFKPWQQAVIPFTVIGIGPVLVGWSVHWVLAGMKNKQ
jgi:hypothetical protein